MGTFNAVPQSAVMRSNSWWRGGSSLRLGWAAGGERAQRAARRLRGAGRGFHNGTLVSYSSKLRSVDMRSSSSSGIGHDMVESLRASYQNPCLAARRRVRSRALRQLVTGEVVTT